MSIYVLYPEKHVETESRGIVVTNQREATERLRLSQGSNRLYSF